MTSLPAKTYGITNRGKIEEGFMADIVIFDPNTVEDKATFVNPHQYPVGIPYVVLNGQLAVDEEKFMNILAGKVLRKNEIQ